MIVIFNVHSLTKKSWVILLPIHTRLFVWKIMYFPCTQTIDYLNLLTQFGQSIIIDYDDKEANITILNLMDSKFYFLKLQDWVILWPNLKD